MGRNFPVTARMPLEASGMKYSQASTEDWTRCTFTIASLLEVL